MSSRVPAADETRNALTSHVIGNKSDAAVTTVASDKSLMAYIKGLVNKDATPTGVGTVFWLKKSLTSSAIVQAGVDVTGVSSGGELAIEDVIVKTDGTGLASATNFELETNNANGLADFFVTAVSGLGANKTVDLDGASVTKIRTVLESGKKVVAKASAADATGDGVIDVYIKFRRLASGATVAAA